jgi:hypothetical protein
VHYYSNQYGQGRGHLEGMARRLQLDLQDCLANRGGVLAASPLSIGSPAACAGKVRVHKHWQQSTRK